MRSLLICFAILAISARAKPQSHNEVQRLIADATTLIAPQTVLMSKVTAVVIGVIGLGLVALMIYVFYFEP